MKGEIGGVRRKRKKKIRANQVVGKVISYSFLVLIAVLIFIPFFQLVLNSLKGPREVETDIFWPTEWYWSNYADVFKETVMLHSFLNTFMYIIPPVIVGTFMSALCAYGFARLEFPGKKIIFGAMMATLVIPNIIIMVPAYVMFANFYQWLGTPLPVVVPGMFGGTVCMFFMLQYIRTLPEDMEEAAMLDGLSRGGVFINIVFPLMIPAFVAQVILNFSGAYNDYLTPLLYLGNSTDLFTVQLAINQMNSAYSVETQKLLAACVIALAPTIVLFLCAQKTFTDGITLTGIK
ncbi:MAG: carbohydrate ABC transporter permease [Bacilli bacterium]|nr:carbohydrate ABC transporter permease [Bacilli bacterium]